MGRAQAQRSMVGNLHHAANHATSAIVSLATLAVNLYYLQWYPGTVVVPAMTAGCCVTAIVCRILKRLINQSRPHGAPKMGPGMPSDHATALSFLSTIACFGLVHGVFCTGRGQDSVTGSAAPWYRQSVMAWMTEGIVTGYGVYCIYLRVRCGHHSWPQVLVGSGLGITSAVLCLGLNYVGYTGPCRGGRLDELPEKQKAALFTACCVVGGGVFINIITRSALVRS